MSDAFGTALTSGQTTAVGYATTALPVVAAVAVAFLGPKIARRIIKAF